MSSEARPQEVRADRCWILNRHCYSNALLGGVNVVAHTVEDLYSQRPCLLSDSPKTSSECEVSH
jgi:hypothetical protein